MEAVFCTLQYPPHEASSWALQKRAFVRNNVWDDIIKLDPTDEGNRQSITKAALLLRGYDVDAVNEKASVPVAAMFEWADLMVLMSRTVGEASRKELARRRSRVQVRANEY